MSSERISARPLIATTMSCAVFSWSERRIVIWPASSGSFSPGCADPDLVGEVGDEAAEVEADLAFFGRDRPFLFFQDFQQLFVRGPVGALPEFLRGRAFQHLVGAVCRRPGAGRRRSVRPAPWCRRGAFRSVPFRRRRFRRAGRPGSCRPLRGSSGSGSGGRWSLTQSSVLSAWRSVQIAKTLRKASSEPSTIRALTRRRRPRLIGGMVYVEP